MTTKHVNPLNRSSVVFITKEMKKLYKHARSQGFKIVHRRKPYRQIEIYAGPVLAMRAVNNGDAFWCAEYDQKYKRNGAKRGHENFLCFRP
jgi:hypothetical protein